VLGCHFRESVSDNQMRTYYYIIHALVIIQDVLSNRVSLHEAAELSGAIIDVEQPRFRHSLAWE
jgi:hypothetical protein